MAMHRYMRRSFLPVLLLAGSALPAVDALAADYSRTEITGYHDDPDDWVLGQTASVKCAGSVPASTACDGDLVSQRTFTAKAQPQTYRSFGKLRQTVGYNADGTVAWVRDGASRQTTLSNWYRGIPRSISYADGSTQSVGVNADGTVASVTDENGFTSRYQYDSMGRLNHVAYPEGDAVAWAPTARTFSVVAGVYGLPSHWRMWERTGSGYSLTHYDAMWRPVVVESYDNADAANTRSIVVNRYDAAGRQVFQSYPVRSLGNWNDAGLKGIRTSYDALGRTLDVVQDSELGALASRTRYLHDASGPYTEVTNPRGQQTRTWFQAFDQPAYDAPVTIRHPAGAFTHITRDPFGKPTVLRRSNSSSPTGGTAALNRSYVYDAQQQLCKQIEPETGATVMAYDAAGNLQWSASGQALPSTTACNTANVPASERVLRAYDARNRLVDLQFPGGNGSQAWTYTPDGLPASVVTWNDGGSNWVTNSYSYNHRRLLAGESQSISDGIATWAFGYGYTANGHLASLVYPGNLTIDYAPNALGQPTRAGNFATGVSYHPSGAIKQFTYGNGLVFSMAENARQLPDRIRSAQGSLVIHDESMDYDQNGNVAAISDALPGHRGDRTMSYDGLDRLTATDSPMFPGGVVYAYDVLDNLKRVKAPGRDHTYHYDGSNRLHNVTNTVGGGAVIGLGYDVRGNLANKSGQAYVFDHGNRLRSATGLESYRYDAEGRRIKATTAGGVPIYSVYGKGGQLLFQRDERVARRFEFIYLGNTLIGTRRRPIGATTEELLYYHTDVLGSNVAITNPARQVAQRSEYEPYGKVLNRATNNRPGFTGHVEDAATGLTYMQQRYYDPMIPRFLSVDPVTAYSNPVGAFNRYAYAFNNPYKFTDPDGRFGCAASRIKSVCESHGMASTSLRSPLDTGVNQQSGSPARSASNSPQSTPPTDAGSSGQSAASAVRTVADANGMIAGTRQNHLAYGGMWRGSNGKLYSESWGGNQHTGARSAVLQEAHGLRVAGQGLFLVSSGISLYEGAGALQRGDGFGVTKAGVDIGWGAAATFGGPVGLVGGSVYTGTSLLITIPTVRQHTVEPVTDGMCWASGNC